jgi:hypothetical protein
MLAKGIGYAIAGLLFAIIVIVPLMIATRYIIW